MQRGFNGNRHIGLARLCGPDPIPKGCPIPPILPQAAVSYVTRRTSERTFTSSGSAARWRSFRKLIEDMLLVAQTLL